METEMLMPQMGESIAEATILKWLKNVGDTVEKDETILEISTDKVDSEIPAPASGVIKEIKAAEGDTVPVKAVIAIISSDAAGAVTAPKQEAKKDAAPKPAAAAAPEKISTVESTPAPAAASQTQPVAAPVSAGASASGMPTKVGNRFYSPLVRSLAAQYGITPNELGNVSGSGANGRVTKEDLLSYMQFRGQGSGAGGDAATPRPSMPPAEARPQYNAEGIFVEPFDNMRKRIAEHMVVSKATSPHVYSVAEIDVTNIAKWRKKVQAEFVSREGFKISYTPFFLEAVSRALVHFPRVNASVEGESLVLKKNVNLGCAVALGTTGLIVPVIKDADQLTLVGLARQLQDLAGRARDKKLKPEEVQGGTFTLTNPGTFGNIFGCPIINQPQLAILGVGAIKKRPMVVGDAIAIRDIVLLTLSYDHRVIDGALGGQFLQYIGKYLESWDMNRSL